MRFSLIDRIEEVVPGESIRTVKTLSLAEEYLADHFPGFAVMPGVMMVESLVQSCAWLSRVTDEFRFSTVLLRRARAVKFNNFVKPGQTMVVTARLRSNDEATAEFTAEGTSDGLSTVKAKLTLEKLNLADRNPSMAAADERMLAAAKELYGQLHASGALESRSQ